MKYYEMAERLAKVCYSANSEDSTDFAIQLFIENLVLPEDVYTYSEESMKEHIYVFIKEHFDKS